MFSRNSDSLNTLCYTDAQPPSPPCFEAWIKVRHVFGCKVITELSQLSWAQACGLSECEPYSVCAVGFSLCCVWQQVRLHHYGLSDLCVNKQRSTSSAFPSIRINSAAGRSRACKHLSKKHFYQRKRVRGGERQTEERRNRLFLFWLFVARMLIYLCMCCWGGRLSRECAVIGTVHSSDCQACRE